MEEKQNAALGTAPLGKLMVKFALPCTISLLVGGAVQHRRPDLHRLGRGVSWQRRDERRVPADG